MIQDFGIHFGAGPEMAPQNLLLSQAVKHGVVVGATGSGKTVSLQVLAEGFASRGVPVVMTDVKGDQTGLARLASESPELAMRRRLSGSLPRHHVDPSVTFWDNAGKMGRAFSIPAQDLGAEGFTRLIDVSPAQASLLTIVFDLVNRAALPLDDLGSLRQVLNWMGRNHECLSQDYGLVGTASLGTLVRKFSTLQNQGADDLIGPGSSLLDHLLIGKPGIDIVDSRELVRTPQLYAGLCYWLLIGLFDNLPELGSVDQPRLVFIIDEAHLLFRGAPKEVINEIERVIRLIRSRGVGIFLCSQNPADIPKDILGQLSNRIVHALRSFTPAERQALRAVSDGLAVSEGSDKKSDITKLDAGCALVSFLSESGAPNNAVHTIVRPPCSVIGALDSAELRRHLDAQGGSLVSMSTQAPLAAEIHDCLDRLYNVGSDRIAAPPASIVPLIGTRPASPPIKPSSSRSRLAAFRLGATVARSFRRIMQQGS